MADINYPIANNDEFTQHKLDYVEQMNLKLNNLITNGNFSSNIEGGPWNAIGTESILTIIDNVAIATGNTIVNLSGRGLSLSASLNYRIYTNAGYKYYVSANIKCNNLNDFAFLRLRLSNDIIFNNISNTNFNKYSGVIESISTGNTIHSISYIYPINTDITGFTMCVDDYLVIDLTTIFGAGNEPTKQEMDLLISLLGGWFDGEITPTQKQLANWYLNRIRLNKQEIDTKASKVQEAWITPTLLNGATDYIAAYQSLQYRKNQFGSIEIKGLITAVPNGTTIIIMPSGYRPTKLTSFVALTSGTSRAVAVEINNSTGEVKVFGTATSYIAINGEVFL